MVRRNHTPIPKSGTTKAKDWLLTEEVKEITRNATIYSNYSFARRTGKENPAHSECDLRPNSLFFVHTL